MEKHIMGENGISYTLGEDGLYYPDLYLPEETEYPIGKYGMLRKTYLKDHRKGLYLELVLAGKLNEHLHQTDEECNQMMDRLVEQMKEVHGVTEELKMQDQMAWVGKMNNIRACAEVQEWGKAILQAAVIIVILFFFCWPMRISGSSMESTMKDGEIVLMSRFATMQEKYETGDIVMFHYYDADGGKTVVKRIIATEGDHIRILADGGVEVNGARVQEEYVHDKTDGLVDMTVPKGTVFVMGE